MATVSILMSDAGAMGAFGRKLGAKLFPGAVIALVGPLGAGKTFLVRAIAEGLGIANPAEVTSPTFVLHQVYVARLPIHHFDVYRLKLPQDFIALGALEHFEEEGVCLVEWADRISPLLPADHLRIEIEIEPTDARRVTIIATGRRHGGLF